MFGNSRRHNRFCNGTRMAVSYKAVLALPATICVANGFSTAIHRPPSTCFFGPMKSITCQDLLVENPRFHSRPVYKLDPARLGWASVWLLLLRASRHSIGPHGEIPTQSVLLPMPSGIWVTLSGPTKFGLRLTRPTSMKPARGFDFSGPAQALVPPNTRLSRH